MLIIEFEPEGLVDKVEGKIILQLKERDKSQSLLLDMTSIQFIRVEALVYLISFISFRKKNNLETKIKYYSNDNIRTFLHHCRFFETVKDVAEIDIYDLVVDLPPDFNKKPLAIDYFIKSKYEFSSEGYSRPLSEEERVEHWSNSGFYPLVSLPFSTDSEKSYTLKKEPGNWTEGKLLISIIQRNLPDKLIIGDKISKHIIYESITNSIRHSESQKLVISCIKQKNYYTLVIWDDGESIIETLMNELKKGNPIKTENSVDDIQSCYCIQKEKKPGRPDIDNFACYFSFEVPNLFEQDENKSYRKQEWFILLSSLFPGITRDPNRTDYPIKIFNQEDLPLLTGRGLTYLINAAVRNFGGEVRIRTSNFFINIKKVEDDFKTLPDLFFKKFKNEFYVIDYKKKYDLENITPHNKRIINSVFKAKIQEFSKEEATFHGNMITVHIPQRKES